MPRVAFLLLACLLILAPLLPSAARAQLISPCDCAKCLAVSLLKTTVAERHYSEGLALAEARAQWARRIWRLDASTRAHWGDLNSLIEAMTRPVLRSAHDKIGDEIFEINQKVPACAPELGGLPVFMSVDPQRCEVRESLRKDALLGSPCFSYYLATLAHEVVHIEDCREAKAGRNFTAIELLRTEVRATQIEMDVLRVLYKRQAQNRQCTPTSANLQSVDEKQALEFLERAEDYHLRVSGDGL